MLERFDVSARLVFSRADRDKSRSTLTLACQLAPERANALVLALLESPEIVDAALRFDS